MPPAEPTNRDRQTTSDGCTRRFGFVAALALATGPAAAQTATPAVRTGVVRTLDSRPIAFADLSIDGGRPFFADDSGRFRVNSSGARTITLRARRVGFKPDTLVVDLRRNPNDTIRLTLTEVHIELSRTRVSADRCPLRASTPDTAVVTIIQQARLAAERGGLFAGEYPYALRMERSLGNASPGSDRLHVKSKSVFAVDTLDVAGAPEWHYTPGDLVGPVVTDDHGNDPHASMNLPQLADFASDAFAAAHCVRYGGRETSGGQDLIRVDFVPAPGLRTPDVSGSLFLDAGTFALRKTSMSIEVVQLRGTWTTYVETSFRELYAGVAAIDRITQLTYARDDHGGVAARVATEDQRVLDVIFADRRPDSAMRR